MNRAVLSFQMIMLPGYFSATSGYSAHVSFEHVQDDRTQIIGRTLDYQLGARHARTSIQTCMASGVDAGLVSSVTWSISTARSPANLDSTHHRRSLHHYQSSKASSSRSIAGLPDRRSPLPRRICNQRRTRTHGYQGVWRPSGIGSQRKRRTGQQVSYQSIYGRMPELRGLSKR
jgi:hypothetical protein